MPSETNGRFGEPLRGCLSGGRFSYESVPSNVAAFLRGQADRIRQQCAISVIQIGKALVEAKRYLSHGEFLRWVESEVCIPSRSAQAYMRAAKWVADKHATVARLSPSALYLLSASGTPEEFAANILKRIEAGEYISPSDMRAELKMFRSTEPQERVGAGSATAEDRLDQSNWGATRAERGTTGVVSELVAILIQNLPANDFARVREIMTSNVVLSDPLLVQNLEHAFQRIAEDRGIPRMNVVLQTECSNPRSEPDVPVASN
ncbi:DUF3102 domain-containing protein [Bradyrhizobium sp. Ec3.3]|uniref:DUF3102 domain-containing protein n=1 Tax=Bradyrhizobium sp. Ec3.3 TaxID=189753 RepID=UPI0018DC4F03|nr:DUF3102 domain-containing protein [Bradyrhizobium sp. Ec3.3]